jgi:hypothetical protein
MTEQEEQILKSEVDAGVDSGCEVIWNPDNETGRKVYSVTTRTFKDPDEDEPGLCANFSNGEYVALYGCELRDFVVARRL